MQVRNIILVPPETPSGSGILGSSVNFAVERVVMSSDEEDQRTVDGLT